MVAPAPRLLPGVVGAWHTDGWRQGLPNYYGPKHIGNQIKFCMAGILARHVGCALRTFIMHRRDACATKFSITFKAE